jgi:hypothetical protein
MYLKMGSNNLSLKLHGIRWEMLVHLDVMDMPSITPGLA